MYAHRREFKVWETWQSKSEGRILEAGHCFPPCPLDASFGHRLWGGSCRFGVVTWTVPKPRKMPVIHYKGYRIESSPVGKGWRASIYAPGSAAPWPNSPANLEKSDEAEIVSKAKQIIDERLGPRLI
jgi:hypothetical protein